MKKEEAISVRSVCRRHRAGRIRIHSSMLSIRAMPIRALHPYLLLFAIFLHEMEA